jgi:hypothetical protein
MSSCRILDDKDLEEHAVKLNKTNRRQWLPESVPETRVFDQLSETPRGFTKRFHKDFMKPFHIKRSSDGRPSDGRPSDGRPSDGRPSDGRPSDGRPSNGRPSRETHSEEPLSEETANLLQRIRTIISTIDLQYRPRTPPNGEIKNGELTQGSL